jgi:hypothetical protein
MPVKRPVDDDDDGGGGAGNGQLHHMPAAKASRHDLQHQQHQDYDAHQHQHQTQHHAAQQQQQASARKKGVSNRTGQACDRCKVRESSSSSSSQCHDMSYVQHACTHLHTASLHHHQLTLSPARR